MSSNVNHCDKVSQGESNARLYSDEISTPYEMGDTALPSQI